MSTITKLLPQILSAQKNEITEYHVYKKLAHADKNEKNKKILNSIAADEMRHYNFWKNLSKTEIPISRIKYFFYTWLSRLFGLTFGIRLMERGEVVSQKNYEKLLKVSPDVKKLINDEQKHEHDLINILDVKGLEYTGSIILGLNDALVELTGALAGFTLALNDTKLIAIVGLITGIAASLSMAASEYLSKKEEGEKNPAKFSLYTGLAYVSTVIILIIPFFTIATPVYALGTTLSFAVLIIFIFTFYSSIARNISFKRKFLEMAAISLGVAILNFFIGYLVRKYIADV